MSGQNNSRFTVARRDRTFKNTVHESVDSQVLRGGLYGKYEALTASDAGVQVSNNVSITLLNTGTDTGTFNVTLPVNTSNGQLVFVKNNTTHTANVQGLHNVSSSSGDIFVYAGDQWQYLF